MGFEAWRCTLAISIRERHSFVRWSIVVTIPIAIFWIVWRSVGRDFPVTGFVTGIDVDGYRFWRLPVQLSRWCDLLLGPAWVYLLHRSGIFSDPESRNYRGWIHFWLILGMGSGGMCALIGVVDVLFFWFLCFIALFAASCGDYVEGDLMTKAALVGTVMGIGLVGSIGLIIMVVGAMAVFVGIVIGINRIFRRAGRLIAAWANH
jgi:hypothetical protein